MKSEIGNLVYNIYFKKQSNLEKFLYPKWYLLAKLNQLIYAAD